MSAKVSMAARELGLADGYVEGVTSIHHPFVKHFILATHGLLTSCSRQEVQSHFSYFEPKTQDFLYKVYVLVVAQIRENIVAEFCSICEETKVLEVLDHVSEGVSVNSSELSDRIFPEKVLREMAMKRKAQEIVTMKRRLDQVKEENGSLAAQLEGLRVSVEGARDQCSVNGLIEKTRDVIVKIDKNLLSKRGPVR